MSSLKGRSVVSFRPAHQAEGFTTQLKSLGATVYEIPLLKLIEGDLLALKNVSEKIAQYDWIIFTSANGVDALSKYLDLATVHSKIATIGPATAERVKKYGAHVTVFPETYIAEEIAPLLGNLKGKKILLPRAKKARDVLPLELKRLGADVDTVVAYDVAPEFSSIQILENINTAPDYLTFTSSSTVSAAIEILGKANKSNWLKVCKRVAIGPITNETLELSGFSPNLVAKEYTTKGIVDCIVKSTGENING